MVLIGYIFFLSSLIEVRFTMSSKDNSISLSVMKERNMNSEGVLCIFFCLGVRIFPFLTFCGFFLYIYIYIYF